MVAILLIVVGIAGIGSAWLLGLKAVGMSEFRGAFTILLAIMLPCAFVVIDVRARLARNWGSGDWGDARVVVPRMLMYAAALVPVAMLISATAVQLPSAKLCTTSGFSEVGQLIGNGGGGVYLAEPTDAHRRIAAFPADQVEELFIGPAAADAQCNPHPQKE